MDVFFYMIENKKNNVGWPMPAYLFFMLIFISCGQKRQEPVVTPWGQITDTVPYDEGFDLDAIQRNGELIALTLTGPETYYDYHGRHLGTQYMLAQSFADKLGVMLRMEVCRDSAEMLQRLADGEADLRRQGHQDRQGKRPRQGSGQFHSLERPLHGSQCRRHPSK